MACGAWSKVWTRRQCGALRTPTCWDEVIHKFPWWSICWATFICIARLRSLAGPERIVALEDPAVRPSPADLRRVVRARAQRVRRGAGQMCADVEQARRWMNCGGLAEGGLRRRLVRLSLGPTETRDAQRIATTAIGIASPK